MTIQIPIILGFDCFSVGSGFTGVLFGVLSSCARGAEVSGGREDDADEDDTDEDRSPADEDHPAGSPCRDHDEGQHARHIPLVDLFSDLF